VVAGAFGQCGQFELELGDAAVDGEFEVALIGAAGDIARKGVEGVERNPLILIRGLQTESVAAWAKLGEACRRLVEVDIERNRGVTVTRVVVQREVGEELFAVGTLTGEELEV